MNIEQLRKELEVDEGVKYEIYNDHLGYPTFGIGHLVGITTLKMESQLELQSQKIESLKPSTKTLKQCLATAQYYMMTSMNCQKKLN